MIKSLPAALFLLLLVTCNIHAQSGQQETLKNYQNLTNSLLQDGGKWIRQNQDRIPGDSSSTSHYTMEFSKGIHGNTIQLKLKNYLPLRSEWKIISELVLSWNPKKQKAILFGVSFDGMIINGESELITSNELRLISSSVSAKGISEKSKEVFRFKDGKLEVSSTIKITDTKNETASTVFNKMEQPSGDLIFMSTRDGNFEIYSMDIQGENLKNLSCNKATDYAFSSFNNRLLFYSNRDGNNEIYVQEADGKKLTNLTNNPASDRIPNFSPDGKQILFISNRDHQSGEIYAMDSTGKNVKRITSNGYFEDAAIWSNDGKKIYFSRELRDLSDTSANAVTNGEIFVMDADGTNETRLTNRPGFDGGPVPSPDGSKIAFYGKTAEGNYEIFLMDADGKNIINLTEDGLEDYSPAWSPDGKWIAYTKGNSKNYDVWMIHLDTKIKTRLTTQTKRDESPIWLPRK